MPNPKLLKFDMETKVSATMIAIAEGVDLSLRHLSREGFRQFTAQYDLRVNIRLYCIYERLVLCIEYWCIAIHLWRLHQCILKGVFSNQHQGGLPSASRSSFVCIARITYFTTTYRVEALQKTSHKLTTKKLSSLRITLFYKIDYLAHLNFLLKPPALYELGKYTSPSEKDT